MKPTGNKRLETIIYSAIWLIILILYLLNIMRINFYNDLPLVNPRDIFRLIFTMLPYTLLFLTNNFILIPRLLKRGKYTKYFLYTLCVILLIWIWQQLMFFNLWDFEPMPKGPERPGHPGPHPLLPLPVFLDMVYDILIIGINLSISLLFQNFAGRLQHERLKKKNIQNQLTYLKAQINPHFYMNMLNNIHGMIEIDSIKAQKMVIQMSSLMRYMLYDSSMSEIAMQSEIKFIKDYLALMKVRYPEDIVSIKAEISEADRFYGVKIPPLLFLVFLENAFKHGISYSTCSFVSVFLGREQGKIVFKCSNSLHRHISHNHRDGIGLGNVNRRLQLIYGNNYTLEINQTESTYTTTLTLPI